MVEARRDDQECDEIERRGEAGEAEPGGEPRRRTGVLVAPPRQERLLGEVSQRHRADPEGPAKDAAVGHFGKFGERRLHPLASLRRQARQPAGERPPGALAKGGHAGWAWSAGADARSAAMR